jgi:tetratricopeptide (TPR) repeat protein
MIQRLVFFIVSAAWLWVGLPSLEGLQAQESRPVRSPVSPTVMDRLFMQLGAAETPLAAKKIADQIERRWNVSGSDTADLLARRADIAARQSDDDLAIELLDRALVLQPDWAEGFYQRAALFAALNDDSRAVADLAQALKWEPRHYEAMILLAELLQKQDQKKSAYDLYQRVLTLYPMHESVQRVVERLRNTVRGQDL